MEANRGLLFPNFQKTVSLSNIFLLCSIPQIVLLTTYQRSYVSRHQTGSKIGEIVKTTISITLSGHDNPDNIPGSTWWAILAESIRLGFEVNTEHYHHRTLLLQVLCA